MRMLFALYLSILVYFLMSCSSREQIKPPVDNTAIEKAQVENSAPTGQQEKEYNFKFVGYDININDPELDRRSYYKIYIDKVDAGRTTIGLESQKKTFESRISIDRHLLIIEKWVLDEKKGQYVKLNNIEQPKPGYLYFDLPDDKIAVIILKNDPLKNKSQFQVDFEN